MQGGKDIIIIGAGIAGLSAGCYLQMNGYDTEIYEMNHTPGGLCTAWRRNGYTIEGCLHGFLGSKPSHPYYSLWNEVVDMSAIRFVDQDVMVTYLFANGERFDLYADLDKLAAYMTGISPEDKAVIEEFICDIRRMQTATMPVKPKEFMNLLDFWEMLKDTPALSTILKWRNVSARDFARRFKNPLLQKVVERFASPVIFQIFVLSEMDLKRCGYPVITSLGLAREFEKKYLSLGGTIHYGQKVTRILTENGQATGVELGSSETYRARMVISAADGHTTLFELLGGRYLDKKMAEAYAHPHLKSSLVQVALGLNRNFSDAPATLKLVLDNPLSIPDGTVFPSMDIRIYRDVPELSPPGKTLAVVQLETRHDEYWTGLRDRSRDKYQASKDRVAQDVIALLEERVGGIRNTVEMVDVTTPATYQRYTGNWRGSIQGWDTEKLFAPNPFKRELHDLANFYMAGQWVEPGGGVPSVFKSGRDLAQIICRKDKKTFHTATN